MGRLKEKMITDGAFGLDVYRPTKPVCADCIEDEALREVVEECADTNYCEYCGAEADHPIAAPLDQVTEHMGHCIRRVYCDPAETLPYESREGGYIGKVYDMAELLWEVGFEADNEQLQQDVIDSFSCQYWAEDDWQALDPGQRMVHGWKGFADAVKHHRRFTFWSMEGPKSDPHYEDHPDYMPVGKMLDRIAEAIARGGIFRDVASDTQLWRVRVHDSGVTLAHDSDFAAPPVELCRQPNRMSPAGVAMFYASEDFETAVAETLVPSRAVGKTVTGGCFHPLQPLTLLDLHDLPAIPSFFDEARFDLRYTLIFLRAFARNVSEPIMRDGREHIDYVPTQAFSEFVRYQMKTSDGRGIDGIRYSSSKNQKACYVIFCDHDQCMTGSGYGPPQVLQFDASTLRTSPADGTVDRE